MLEQYKWVDETEQTYLIEFGLCTCWTKTNRECDSLSITAACVVQRQIWQYSNIVND